MKRSVVGDEHWFEYPELHFCLTSEVEPADLCATWITWNISIHSLSSDLVWPSMRIPSGLGTDRWPSAPQREFEKRDNMCVSLGCHVCNKPHHTTWQMDVWLHTWDAGLRTSNNQQSRISIRRRCSVGNYFYLKPTTFMSLEQSLYH